MERLTIPDVRVDEHTTRRSVIDVAAVREHTMEIYWRLKAYEDTGLTPEEIKAPFTEDTMINLAAQALGVEPSRLRELAEADKDGRVVVLPCKGYSDVDIVRDGVSYRPDHWNIHLTAYAHEQNTPSGLKVGLFDIGEVERAMQEMEGKKDG
jgi:hypothetical protein